MKKLIVLCSLLAASPLFAQSREAPEATAEVGGGTRQWIDLQISGAASVPQPRPVSGEVATTVYQRYVDSFKYPIPQYYSRDSFKSQGTSATSSR